MYSSNLQRIKPDYNFVSCYRREDSSKIDELRRDKTKNLTCSYTVFWKYKQTTTWTCKYFSANTQWKTMMMMMVGVQLVEGNDVINFGVLSLVKQLPPLIQSMPFIELGNECNYATGSGLLQQLY